MHDQDSARNFISYSRKDGESFAAELRAKLEAEGLSIWQDIVALEGGRDWWSQIEDTIKSKALQHFILVVTPGALDSPVVRREIRLARQEGKTVCPIKGPGLGDLSDLPRWLGQLYDLDLPEHWTTLIRVLEAPSQQKRVAMMAPEVGAAFLGEWDEAAAHCEAAYRSKDVVLIWTGWPYMSLLLEDPRCREWIGRAQEAGKST